VPLGELIAAAIRPIGARLSGGALKHSGKRSQSSDLLSRDQPTMRPLDDGAVLAPESAPSQMDSRHFL
jgi:hypothetical protein